MHKTDCQSDQLTYNRGLCGDSRFGIECCYQGKLNVLSDVVVANVAEKPILSVVVFLVENYENPQNISIQFVIYVAKIKLKYFAQFPLLL